MKKNIDNLINEIKNGKNLEVNLSKFGESLTNDVYEYSLIKLTMNYFTYYEVVKDHENPEVKRVRNIANTIHDILHDLLFLKHEVVNRKDIVDKLDNLRSEMKAKMQILTSYTDVLQNYEYILNRKELKYEIELPTINDEIMAKEIVDYIFDTKDNVIVNQKIKDVIGQLPIRFTKSKYFDLLRNSLSVYKGSDKSSVISYIYILRTSAMIYKPEGMNTDFPELVILIDLLAKADYKNLDQETFNRLVTELKNGAESISHMVDAYMSLQEMVNNLYAFVLTGAYIISTNEEVEEACLTILKEINERFVNKDYTTKMDQMFEKLVMTEGRQEILSHDLSRYEGTLSDIIENNSKLLGSLLLWEKYHSLDICKKLLSVSLFMDLEDNTLNEIADNLYIVEVTNTLIGELKVLFQENNQLVNRAIMANTINKMPIFFQNINDVAEYILDSLTGCHDNIEKVASINLIQQIMD